MPGLNPEGFMYSDLLVGGGITPNKKRLMQEASNVSVSRHTEKN